VYFLHFDPVGGALTNKIATLTFPEEIIGLILKRDTLFATDPLVGLTSTVAYPAPNTHPAREVEIGPEDQVTLHGDRRRITVDFRTSTSSDQMRIITVSRGEP